MTNTGGHAINPVLLIIDDPDISTLLSLLLKSEGFAVHQAYDGSIGIKMAYGANYEWARGM